MTKNSHIGQKDSFSLPKAFSHSDPHGASKEGIPLRG